jgi:hypothetical protein
MSKIASLLLFLLVTSLETYAQEEKFIPISIYNFTRYIEWPADDNSSEFIIDIIGHKSIYDKLKEITTGHTVGKRNITVRFLSSVNEITKSHILFVGFWQSGEFSKAMEKVGNNPTLVISEKDGLIEVGSGINFVIRNSNIKFEIKKANIQKNGLKVGADLEAMAFKSY